MKRFHVHIAVADLDSSVRFYSTLFGTAPTVLKPDYAKWMLDDPRVNFAISSRGAAAGIDHVGIQVESNGELSEISERLASAGREIEVQKDAACCYARGHKTWVKDPQGVSWETFLTFGESTIYGEDLRPNPVTAQKAAPAAACCGRASSSAGK